MSRQNSINDLDLHGSNSISIATTESTSQPQKMVKISHQKLSTSSVEGAKVYVFKEGAIAMIKTGPLNILLVFVPLAFISYFSHWSDGVTFAFSLLGIAPLAERLGFCTEQLAIHTNDTIGGLLNATFGNATELIVALLAISKKLYRLVQLSLLGSILSNLLLVLGCAFFFGGIKFKVQRYSKIASEVNSTLLLLATIAIVYPSVLTMNSRANLPEVQIYSLVISILLFIIYWIFIYFQIISHKDLFESEDDDPDSTEVLLNPSLVENQTHDEEGGIVDANGIELQKLDSLVTSAHNINFQHRLDSSQLPEVNANEDNVTEDEEEDILGLKYALFWLSIVTAFIAVLSDAIASSIENAGKSYKISSVFLSVIVLPIVGNAAEHASAVIFAIKNKLDISIGVAVGSSTQIAVLVIPTLVILGWMMGHPVTLDFGFFEGMTLLLTVILTGFAIKDGSSNYLTGLVLITAYFVVAGGFLVCVDENLD